jgi:hypothetical protein
MSTISDSYVCSVLLARRSRSYGIARIAGAGAGLPPRCRKPTGPNCATCADLARSGARSIPSAAI